jgi:stalled ribosome rescue protein Dom34
MSTFHAVVWIDQSEAHVVMFDREHMQTQRIKSRTHHKHQGKATDSAAFFADVARALAGSHEVLLTGPGLVRNQLRDWCTHHLPAVADAIVDSVPGDHPSDAQLVALARRYFRKFDAMAGDPASA